MSAPPFMQLYVADYLADTTHLSAVEHGGYLLLLMSLWRAGGKLPKEPGKLCKIARMTDAEWAASEEVLMAFFVIRGGAISHKRVTRELERYQSVVDARKTAGKASAAKRANKNNEQASTHVETLLEQNPTNQNQNQNQNQIIELEPLRVSNSISRASEFERFWEAYPEKKGKRIAETAFAKARKRTDLQTMLWAIEDAKSHSKKWLEGYIPNPTTWLNQDRWNDEHSDRPTAAPQLIRRHENMRRAVSGFAASADPRDHDG